LPTVTQGPESSISFPAGTLPVLNIFR